MFIGHFGTGFAAKSIDKRPSLGTFFLAAQFIDLLWPLFLLLGIEKVKIEPGISAFTPLNFIYYPFSHSFFGVLVWAALLGNIYFFLKKDLKTSVLLGLLVLSHWVLDLMTHIPDLPLIPWNDFKVGLGLWNSITFTIIIEGAIFILGIYLYLRTTQAANKKGSIGLWSLILFLIITYIVNVFGTPPPNEEAIGYAGLSMWLLVAWGYWVDSKRNTIEK